MIFYLHYALMGIRDRIGNTGNEFKGCYMSAVTEACLEDLKIGQTIIPVNVVCEEEELQFPTQPVFF